jgi:hypothetical protein
LDLCSGENYIYELIKLNYEKSKSSEEFAELVKFFSNLGEFIEVFNEFIQNWSLSFTKKSQVTLKEIVDSFVTESERVFKHVSENSKIQKQTQYWALMQLQTSLGNKSEVITVVEQLPVDLEKMKSVLIFNNTIDDIKQFFDPMHPMHKIHKYMCEKPTEKMISSVHETLFKYSNQLISDDEKVIEACIRDALHELAESYKINEITRLHSEFHQFFGIFSDSVNIACSKLELIENIRYDDVVNTIMKELEKAFNVLKTYNAKQITELKNIVSSTIKNVVQNN